MPHSRLSFSDRAIGALPFAASGQHIVRDEDVRGFFLLVGTRSKTFMIQGDLWENGKRRTIRVKIGEVGKIATREARAKAKVLLGSIADGVDPRPKPEEPVVGPGPNGPDPPLKQAWERYRDGHMKRKGRSTARSRTTETMSNG
jgi:Arm DNA-binding domain